MDIRVARTSFSKLNKAYVSLILIDNEVDLWTSSYVMHRLDKGHPLKTIESEVKAIKKFYQFCSSNNIDPIATFASLSRLTAGQIEALSAYYSVRQDTGEVVAQGTYNLRWTVTKAFIRFVWDFYLSRVERHDDLKAAQLKLEGMEKAFAIHGKMPYTSANPDKIGLTPELRAEFLDIINPSEENKLNPWKNSLVRWRNYCLFLTMMLGGNRKGESLGLELNHFSLTGPPNTPKYYEIIREDRMTSGYPRREIPSVKTQGRRVELSDDLSAVFEHYLTKVRPKFQNAKKSTYVFLSLRDGLPLYVGAPNDALNIVISKHPQFAGNLTPHILRHTFHDLLREKLDSSLEASGPIAKQGLMSALHEYAGGWVRGSQMVSCYPKGSIQRRVGELHLTLQRAILRDSENGENKEQ